MQHSQTAADTNPRGSQLNRIEPTTAKTQSAKTQSAKTGLLATLRALLRTAGTSAPAGFRAPTPSRRAGRVPAVLCGVAGALALLLIPSSALAATPALTTNPAEEVGITTVKLSGTVNSEGSTGAPNNTTWRIQYAPAGTEAWANANETGIVEPASEEASPVAVEASFGFAGELQPGHEYEFRLQAEGPGGEPERAETPTPYPTFTTKAATAPVLTVGAPEASYVTAHLSGTVDPQGGNINPIGGPLAIAWQLQFALASEPGNWQLAKAAVIEGTEAESNTAIEVQGVAGDGTFSGPLQPATAYTTRLLVTYAGSETVIAAEEPAFETLPVAPPAVSIEPIATFTATTAHLTGSVNPEGADPAFNSACRFDYVTQAGWVEGGESFAFASSVPCEPETVQGAGAQAVTADLSGLTPHTTYHVRLVASNAGGTSEAIVPETFTTEVQIPLIEGTSAANVTSTSADLGALINTGGGATTYHFEYGTTSAYGQSSPESVSIGSDNSSHPAGLHLAGLEPETTYHYRVVATNSASPIGGSAGPDRSFTTQPAASDSVLPDGRQWELVSPPDKHGAEVENKLFVVGGTMQAAEDGNAVSYVTNSPIDGNSKSNPLENQILARRVPGGWSSQSIATPHAGGGGREFFEAGGGNLVRVQEASEYLVFSPDLSLAYVQPEATTPLAPPAPAPKRVEGLYDSGYVRDNNTGTFSITKQNSKEWYDEQAALSAPSPKCDASSSPVGATVGIEGVRAVSQDGCYVYFNSLAGAGPLEVAHYDGAAWTTTLISSLLDPGDIKWVEDWGPRAPFAELSPNGRYLTFMSSLSLTGYDNTDANSPVGEPRADWEVFLYDAVTDSLTCASCDPTGARPVGKFDRSTGNDSFAPGLLQVDPANYFEKTWLAGLLAPFPLTEQPGPFHVEPLYNHQPRYLTDSGELFFESPVALVPRDVNGTWDVYEYRPQGVGGCTDAGGCPALISSGRSSDESVLIEASTDGSDVFFFTSDRLTGQDVDHVNDVYDAHVCSAAVPCPPPPPPPAPACEGDACQQPATPPNHPTPASRSYSGPENEHPAKTKKKHPKKHKHRGSQHKKKSQKGPAKKRAGRSHGGRR
jgi:hypothetical protein